MNQTILFYQIIDMIDTLSPDEQEELINIVRHRQIDRRRDEIAKNIIESHQEYEREQVFRGTVDEIIAELNR